MSGTASHGHLADAILARLTDASDDLVFGFGASGRGRETLLPRELLGRVRGFANGFIGAGLERGEVVPLVAPTSARLWAAFVGAIAADLVPCILPAPTFKTHVPTYARNLDLLLERYAIRRVFAEAEIVERLAAAGIEAGRLQPVDLASLDRSAGRLVREPGAAESDVAFLQHSSGSTGTPKGVSLSHRAVLEHLGSYAEAIRLDPRRDVVCSWLPLYHDMGLVTSFLMPLALGVRCHSLRPDEWILDPLAILRLASETRSTLSWWPNFTFALLAQRARPGDLAGLDLRSLRALVNCSEPVLSVSVDAFARVFSGCGLAASVPATCYAMAENVFAVTQSGPQLPARAPLLRGSLEPGKSVEPARAPDAPGAFLALSSGRVLSHTAVAVLAADGRPAADGVVGELSIASPWLFSGYQGLPEITASVLRDGRYRTGDLGFTREGEVFVLGRASDLIVVGGRKFYPNDLEHAASEVAGVKEGRVVAFGVLDEARGTEDVVVLVESEAHSDDKHVRRIRREIKARVLQRTDCAVDHALVLPPAALVKTSSGKIARRENRRIYLDELRLRGGH